MFSHEFSIHKNTYRCLLYLDYISCQSIFFFFFTGRRLFGEGDVEIRSIVGSFFWN